MTRYQCPYCSPHYQIHKQRVDGIMICGQCGDPLIKIPLIKRRQIIALIAVIAFAAPLIAMTIAFIQDASRLELKKPLPPAIAHQIYI